MALILNVFDDFLVDALNVVFRNTTASTVFRLILCNGGAFDATSNYATVNAAQLSTGNGYTSGGYVVTPLSAPTEYLADDLASASFQTATVTASGGTITWDQIALVDEVNSRVIGFYAYPSAQSLTDGNSRDLSVIINFGKSGATVDQNPAG